MFRSTLARTAIGAAMCGLAISLGSALRLPALAAQSYDRYVAPFVTATCSSSSPCLQYTNSGTGAAIKGISSSGHGVNGQTDFASTSATNFKAGVYGDDASTSGTFDSGVYGKSNAGTGVFGTSNGGYGVEAASSSNSALFSESTTGDGAQIIGLNNDGTNSSTQNDSTEEGHGRSGVWGHDDSTDGGTLNIGVEGSSTYGTGLQANSNSWVGANIVGGGNDPGFAPALSVVAGPGDPAFVMEVCQNPSDSPCLQTSDSKILSLDDSGDLEIWGKITTAGSCHTGCVSRGRQVQRVVSYAPTQTLPSIDDFGEAQLVNGQAYVPLSADFANVIDPQADYLVFITPEGDSRGLYVTDKTHAGFVVRENEDGHATLAFCYRVMAKPIGASHARLPMESR